MKKEFSKAWKASKQPRKQRKYAANAPLHIRKKKLTINLSKELRKSIGKRNIIVRKEDKVKILRGKFKGKIGKVTGVYTKVGKVEVEGIQVKKQDGSKVFVKLQPSNLQIIETTDRGKKAKPTNETKTDKEIAKKAESESKVKKESKTTGENKK